MVGLRAARHRRGTGVAGGGDILDALELTLREGERPRLDHTIPERRILDLLGLRQRFAYSLTQNLDAFRHRVFPSQRFRLRTSIAVHSTTPHQRRMVRASTRIASRISSSRTYSSV